MKIQTVLLSVMLCTACGAEGVEPESESTDAQQSALGKKAFEVTFRDCAEFAGIGLVPAANARPLVPSRYTLAGDAQNALVVVRVAQCASSVVDGKSEGMTITSQVGIMLAGGDATADINNYTLEYATNQARLHARFKAAGLDADKSNTLALQLVAGTLSASSSSSHTPTFTVQGSATTPVGAPTTFVASWWGEGKKGPLRSRTEFPSIRFGSSGTTLTTPVGSTLAQLVGAPTLTFPILDSYNTFESAQLVVDDQDY